MKRVVLILAACLLLMPAGLLLATGAKEPTTTTEGPVQLRLLWWGGQSRHDKTLKVIDMFQQSNPNIKIEAEYLGWSGYFDRMAVLAAAEDVPDIFQINIERIPQYDQRGLIANLYDIKDFNAKLIGFYRLVYYLPSIVGSSVAIALVWREFFGFSCGSG